MACNCGCCPDTSTVPMDSVCDCCVTPMQNVLAQIPAGTTVSLGTLDTTSGNLSNVIFQSVSDYMAFVTQGINRIAVPVCKITGVSGRGNPNTPGTPAYIIRNIMLQAPVNNTGDCACCEDPVRRFLQRITRTDIDVLGDGFNNLENTTILQVGEGIVKVEAPGLDVAALSSCQISLLTNYS